MKADGSTSGGCWIYTGVYADGVNQAASRKPGREQNLSRARLGLGLAGEPPHPLQPRLRRPGRQAVERAQALRLVGRGRSGSGPGTTCPTSWPTKAPVVPARPGARAARRDSPVTTRSSCRPTARAGSSRPRACSTARCPTHYEPQESPVRNPLYAPAVQPGAQGVPAQGQPVEPVGRRAGFRRLPVRLHDLPAHRAPHGRRHEPLAALPRRSCSRSSSARSRRSWRPSAASRTAAGRRSSRPAPRSRRGSW